jgi:hypothetical protein
MDLYVSKENSKSTKDDILYILGHFAVLLAINYVLAGNGI